MKYSEVAKLTTEELRAFLDSEEELEMDIELDEEEFRNAEEELRQEIEMEKLDKLITMEADDDDDEHDEDDDEDDDSD